MFVNTRIQTLEDFAAAHFVDTAGPNSPCYSAHGHTFLVNVGIEGEVKDDGMVVDFRKIKIPIKRLDHKVLLPDPLFSSCKIEVYDNDYYKVSYGDKYYIFPMCDCIILIGISVVTSENIAKYLLNIYKETYPFNKFTVRVYEGKESYAEVDG